MKSKTTIELNGKQYDARTGTVLGGASAPPVRAGQNIDGFFRARTSTAKTVPIAQKTTVLAAPAPKPHKKPSRAVNHARAHAPEPAKTVAVRSSPAVHSQTVAVHHKSHSANHVKHHVPQSAHTLMRKSVQRPEPSLRKQLHPTGSLQHSTPNLITVKPSVSTIDEGRLVRAKHVSRSPQVSHHNPVQVITPTITSLHVQPAPVRPGGNEPSSPPSPQPDNKPVDIFEHALANASNFADLHVHKKQRKQRHHRRVVSFAAGAFALLLIAGFAAYQNTPGVQLKVAGIRAGVATNSIPNFKAAGFAFNNVHVNDQTLTVGFSGASGNYKLTQQPSNFTTTDLVEAAGVDPSNTAAYKTIHVGDTTVYRFDNIGATWLSNGEWYTITGTGSLSDSQVSSLVGSV